MATHGKKYRAAFEKVDRAKRYTFQEAVQLALATHYTKNDQGLDIAVTHIQHIHFRIVQPCLSF